MFLLHDQNYEYIAVTQKNVLSPRRYTMEYEWHDEYRGMNADDGECEIDATISNR
jgi:hypothetical protein